MELRNIRSMHQEFGECKLSVVIGWDQKSWKIPKQPICLEEKSVLAAGHAGAWVGVESADSVKETEAK